MEAAGIEPASKNVPLENLHTCQVPICYVPALGTCKQSRNTSPLIFVHRPPGQQSKTIPSKVTPFNQPTGELIKDGLLIKQPVLFDSQQLIVSTFLRGHGPRYASLPSAFPSKPVRPPFDVYFTYIGMGALSVNAV